MARYKVLKSVAHSMGHSFTSLMNYADDDYVMGHLLSRAREVREGSLVVDLLSGDAAPLSLLTPPVKDAVERYVSRFRDLVITHRTSLQYVRAARMTVDFDLAVQRPSRYAPGCLESPYVCLVEIEDDRGKLWTAELRGWWFPEAAPPSGQTSKRSRALSHFVRRMGQLLRSLWASSLMVSRSATA